jgi:methylmalonyl-CoA/ethylmalonyl-CoA epimerase
MRKIEHIGIAVNNLETSNLLFEKLFGNPPYKQEEVESEGVKTSFFMNGPNKIELLEATNTESPIAKFLEKKGEGIHHIAFDVENILEEMDRLKNDVERKNREYEEMKSKYEMTEDQVYSG